MNKNDLIKSGIITIASLIIITAFWFGYSAMSWGIDFSTWSSQNMKRPIIYENVSVIPGTSTNPGITFGVTPNVFIGTWTDSAHGRFFLNTSTGNLEFKPPGTTTSYILGSATVSYMDTNFMRIMNGHGSQTTLQDAKILDTTGTNTTFGGTNTFPNNATIYADSVSYSATKLKWLANLTGDVQTNIDSKQGVGTYITGITADGKTGTTTATLVAGSNMSIVAVESNGAITVTFQPAGSASAKPDVQEGGGTTTVGATFLNYNASDFDTTNNGQGTDIALSAAQRGSTTPTADTVMKAGPTGTSSMSWFDAGYCYAYRTTALSGISTGTWTNVPLDSDINDSRYGTHSTSVNTEQVKVLVPGMYEVAARAQARHSAASIGIRLCKNNETEIPGSFAMAYMNYGDSNTGMPIVIAPIQVRLAANDYIYMQVAHNAAGTATAINYAIVGGMPTPTTNTLVTLTLKKIGE